MKPGLGLLHHSYLIAFNEHVVHYSEYLRYVRVRYVILSKF